MNASPWPQGTKSLQRRNFSVCMIAIKSGRPGSHWEVYLNKGCPPPFSFLRSTTQRPCSAGAARVHVQEMCSFFPKRALAQLHARATHCLHGQRAARALTWEQEAASISQGQGCRDGLGVGGTDFILTSATDHALSTDHLACASWFSWYRHLTQPSFKLLYAFYFSVYCWIIVAS